MDQKEYSPREEVTRVFLSEKFLYICILMTVTTLTGIIFSISNSSNTYSYFLNPIINELVNAAMSNVVSVFVVISYIPMIIGTGLLWLMRENARTNKGNLKKSLFCIMAYRVYFYINIFSCVSGIIIINLLGVIVPIAMILFKASSTAVIFAIISIRLIGFIVSVFCIFLGVYLYNAADFLCEVALTVRINKNMITANKVLIYCNYIFAALMVIVAPFSGFTGFIYSITLGAALLLINVCIHDHNYKYEAPEKREVDEFYKNLQFNPEYKEVADALGVKQKNIDPEDHPETNIKYQKYVVILNMLLGTSLYNGEMFKEDNVYDDY